MHSIEMSSKLYLEVENILDFQINITFFVTVTSPVTPIHFKSDEGQYELSC